jgi:hypothetical protein
VVPKITGTNSVDIITFTPDRAVCLLLTLQLSMMVMKPEVKDRIMSHEHPVIAAIYNKKFNQVVLQIEILFKHFGKHRKNVDRAGQTYQLVYIIIAVLYRW